ncbi:MAG: hypothetical protein OXF52_01505 [Candidatus Dadabacteria bacterium]|nr:hypothetical protein [Candidatus Dadabacteria bacterium]
MSLCDTNCVAIDTNVFGHLTDRDKNKDGHINDLLEYLKEKSVDLLVDNKGVITGEYDHHLLNKEKLSQQPQRDTEVYLLEYWLVSKEPKKVNLDCNDDLAKSIKGIIHEPREKRDRVLVYVAFKEKSNLISNDERHIVNRRERLTELSPESEILLSKEAAKRIKQCWKNPNP